MRTVCLADVSQRRVGIRVLLALCVNRACGAVARPRWGCDVLCQGESGSGASLGATYRKV